MNDRLPTEAEWEYVARAGSVDHFSSGAQPPASGVANAWSNGRKTGRETHWDERGRVVWQWDHRTDGTSGWTQFRADGTKRRESTWRGLRCHGPARAWDRAGRLIEEHEFRDGVLLR